uniref:Uncharacterized protein n=1 Tax=viral metagenome TaxID=1070528 RepID=A0A6M3M9R7_9ZZZZ
MIYSVPVFKHYAQIDKMNDQVVKVALFLLNKRFVKVGHIYYSIAECVKSKINEEY